MMWKLTITMSKSVEFCQLCRTEFGEKLRLLLGDRPGPVLKDHQTIISPVWSSKPTHPQYDVVPQYDVDTDNYDAKKTQSIINNVGEEKGKRPCPSQSPTPRIKVPKLYTT
jgi:hypothetical protein